MATIKVELSAVEAAYQKVGIPRPDNLGTLFHSLTDSAALPVVAPDLDPVIEGDVEALTPEQIKKHNQLLIYQWYLIYQLYKDEKNNILADRELNLYFIRTIAAIKKHEAEQETQTRIQLADSWREKGIGFLNPAMDNAYIFCNVVGLISAAILIGLTGSPLWIDILEQSTLILGYAWNYFGTIGAWWLAGDEVYFGDSRELMYAAANTLSGTSVAVLTSLSIASTQGLLYLSTAVATGFTGFSFAFGMFVPFVIETHGYFCALQRIQLLDQEIQTLEAQANKSAAETVKLSAYQNMRDFEYAQRDAHLVSSLAWLGCTIAMTAIAAVTTFGGPPALVLLTIVMAVCTGFFRKSMRKNKETNPGSLSGSLLGWMHGNTGGQGFALDKKLIADDMINNRDIKLNVTLLQGSN